MWQFILHRVFGVAPEDTALAKLGGGVVAFTAYVMLAFCGAVGAISWALSGNPYLALAAIAITALMVGVFLQGTWKFADKHPDQAALGGSWWLQLRQMQYGEKGNPSLPITPMTPNPAQAPPALPRPADIIPPDEE